MPSPEKLTREQIQIGLAGTFIGVAGFVAPLLAAVNFVASLVLAAASIVVLVVFLVPPFRKRRQRERRDDS